MSDTHTVQSEHGRQPTGLLCDASQRGKICEVSKRSNEQPAQALQLRIQAAWRQGHWCPLVAAPRKRARAACPRAARAVLPLAAAGAPRGLLLSLSCLCSQLHILGLHAASLCLQGSIAVVSSVCLQE